MKRTFYFINALNVVIMELHNVFYFLKKLKIYLNKSSMSGNRQVTCSEEKEKILEYLRRKIYPEGLSSEHKRTFRKKIMIFFINDVLCYKVGDGSFKGAIFSFKSD
jgi:hypothetical protein